MLCKYPIRIFFVFSNNLFCHHYEKDCWENAKMLQDVISLLGFLGFYWSNCPCILPHLAKKIGGISYKSYKLKTEFIIWNELIVTYEIVAHLSRAMKMILWYLHDPVRPAFHHGPNLEDHLNKTEVEPTFHY